MRVYWQRYTYLPNSTQLRLTTALEMRVPQEMRSSGSRVRGKAGSGMEEIDPESGKRKKNRGDTIRFVYGLGSNNFWRREQQWWRQGRRFLAKSCERSCICFVLICFRFKINSAVVTLPYVMCRKRLMDVKVMNPDTIQSVFADIRVWTNRRWTCGGIALFGCLGFWMVM